MGHAPYSGADLLQGLLILWAKLAPSGYFVQQVMGCNTGHFKHGQAEPRLLGGQSNSLQRNVNGLIKGRIRGLPLDGIVQDASHFALP